MTRRRDESGAIAIVVAAFTLVMFGFSALVVDLGQARETRRQLQNTADAAALAAGNAMYTVGNPLPDLTAAVAAAKEYAEDNGVSSSAWASCTDDGAFSVPPGGTPCISFRPNLVRPTEVRVRVPVEEVPLPFSAGLGIGTSEVSVRALAQAKIDPGGASRCGLCVLGSGMLHDLQNGDATVHGADIHFNGNVSVSSNGLIATSGAITVEGTAGGPYANYLPDPLINQPPITDPLAGIPMPPSFTGLSQKTDPCLQGPGFYGARNLRNMTCVLAPGLYVIAGSATTTWDLAGNASTRLLGAGVTLYFTCGTSSAPVACNPGQAGANLDASGNGFIGITAPLTGPLQGFAIIYDRNNTSRVRLTGNGSTNMTGTIYAASGAVQMNGNGCSTNYFSLMVIKDLEMNGNPACLQATYNSNVNAQVPPGALHLSR